MRAAILLWPAALCCIAGAVLLPGNGVDSTIASLTVKPEKLAPELPRYGLNLGGSGTWGAEQLRANVLANPGFEPVVDRAIVNVAHVDAFSFSDDTDWLSRSEGFWSGARYDVRSGPAAGQSGKILVSKRSRGNGSDEFAVDLPTTGLRNGDVVSLTRDRDTGVAPHWWKGKGMVAGSSEIPPGSSGVQSLRLIAAPGRPAEILHYLDNIGERAGKLLPVKGKWKLGFWARRVGAHASLQVRFDRERRAAFLAQQIVPEGQWKYYQFEFAADDTGPAGVLTFGLTAHEGEILIDEIYLGEADAGPGGFRRAAVETLQSLRPGYLRDWQGQLGDTLDNRLSGEFAHRPARYRPGNNESQFHYSLPDFLSLCAAVKAQPWVIAPTTLSDEEWRRFGAYLSAAADQFGFTEISVEFGNENWNSIFRPAGIPDAAALSAVADRGFRLLREGAGNDKRLRTIINAQFVNPHSSAQLAKLSRLADSISVAPYFMYQLDAGSSAEEALKLAFSEDASLLIKEAAEAAKLGKRLSVYEVNFHTTLGTASSAQRNRITTSGAAGTALARRLLQGSLAGVREQAVYSFAGFDSYLGGSRELVRLWGITRDLSVPNRLRPTGLALTMLNGVAGGMPHGVDCTGGPCSALTSLAFADGRNIVIASASADTLSVSVACPPGRGYRMKLLDGSDPSRNNEQLPQVAVAERNLECPGKQLRIDLPPYSLLTLEPTAR